MRDASSPEENALDRRDLLKAGLVTGLGTAALASAALGASETGRVAAGSALPLVDFGKTGQRLPILACGGSAFVEKWQEASGPVGALEQRVRMVRHAYEAGLRYFDTSRNYGESERIVGKALRDVRNDIYLASKVGIEADDSGFIEPKHVRANVERSLEILGTDHLDCLQIHGPAFEYRGYDHGMKLYEQVARLREEKLTRFVGLTGHSAFETMHRLLDTGLFDQLLIAYGYCPKGMDTILSHGNLQWRERCLNRARELGMGVLAMKVMGSFVFGFHAAHLVPGFGQERLVALRRAALRWALDDDRITLLLVGITQPSDVDENVETLRGSLALTAADHELLADFSARAFQSDAIKDMKVT